MKRLLCIVGSLDTGGAETFLMKVFRALSEEYKFDFVVSTEKGYYEEEVVSLGGIIHRIPLRTKHPISAYYALKEIVQLNHYQYVLKLCDTPIGYFDLRAAKKGGANRVCVRSCNAATSEGLSKRVINYILRPLFNRIADVKIAPSRLSAEYTFGKNEANNTIYLKNAININDYKYSEEGRKVFREEYDIGDDSFVVGHIGRLSHQKNHAFLVDVFSEIYSVNRNAKLLIVGEGELENQIRNQVRKLGLEKSVIFTGVRSDIQNVLSAMDVFVFPSFYEGMPNTIIEAQASGLKCVLSDTITDEANITGTLKYLSISKNTPADWANYITGNYLKRNDYDYIFRCFCQNGYLIESSSREFVQYIFQDKMQ